MFTMDQLVLHLVGDYLTQTDWMATEKTKRFFPATIHGLVYSCPFLFFLDASLVSFMVIFLSHTMIDRYRLVRYVVWVKNMIPKFRPWKECQATGFAPEMPPWLAVWLMIIIDNTIHILINGFALAYL